MDWNCTYCERVWTEDILPDFWIDEDLAVGLCADCGALLEDGRTNPQEIPEDVWVKLMRLAEDECLDFPTGRTYRAKVGPAITIEVWAYDATWAAAAFAAGEVSHIEFDWDKLEIYEIVPA